METEQMKRTDQNEEWMEEEEELEEKEEGEKNQSLSVRAIKVIIFYLAFAFFSWNFFSFIFSSNFCNIEKVIITGNDYLSEEEVFYKSKIELGENIFKLNLIKTIDFLLQEPWIKGVEIKRAIPNKLIISIKERKAAVLTSIGEEYFVLSKEGLVLSKVNRLEEGFGLPLILGLDIDEIKIGEMIDKPEFRATLECINSAEVILPKKFHQAIILAPDDFMICNKDDILRIRLNRPEEIINKENLLREALEKIEREKLSVEYIDIRFRDSLIIKIKK